MLSFGADVMLAYCCNPLVSMVVENKESLHQSYKKSLSCYGGPMSMCIFFHVLLIGKTGFMLFECSVPQFATGG